MKIHRQSEDFCNIVIVIETKKEADYLWHKLNCPEGTSFAAYCGRCGVEHLLHLDREMYDLFNAIHTPE